MITLMLLNRFMQKWEKNNCVNTYCDKCGNMAPLWINKYCIACWDRKVTRAAAYLFFMVVETVVLALLVGMFI